MTTKKQKKEENIKEDKMVLYEAVQNNNVSKYIIIGALTRAGLIKQYREEELIYGVENIKPTITKTELNEIIRKYIGV